MAARAHAGLRKCQRGTRQWCREVLGQQSEWWARPGRYRVARRRVGPDGGCASGSKPGVL